MAEAIAVGSGVSAGTYVCSKCTNRLSVLSTKQLAPCPVCGSEDWRTVGDAGSVPDRFPGSVPGRDAGSVPGRFPAQRA